MVVTRSKEGNGLPPSDASPPPKKQRGRPPKVPKGKVNNSKQPKAPTNNVNQESNYEVVHQPQEGPTGTVQPAQSTQAKVDFLTGHEALGATCSPDPLDIVLQPKNFNNLPTYDGNSLNWDPHTFLLMAIIDST